MSRASTGTPSIRDVARAAEVSVATASRVLAKTDYPVAAKTRARVIAAANELGFVPNALARGLSRSRSDSIGVVVPMLMTPYYAAMVEGIDEAAKAHGLTMLLSLTGSDETRREAVIDEFLARRVDGILVCAGAPDHVPGRTPDALGVPTVLIGQQANPGFPIIRTDNRRAGFEAADYLWRLGHRRFLYLTSHDTWHDFHDRGQGMLDFLKTTGAPHEAEIVDGLYGEADTYRYMEQAIDRGIGATALIGSTDRHALGALAALSDAGRKVPDDVSVMGFDDYITSTFVRPALTTMRMPSAEMGRLGVIRLGEMLAGGDVPPETVLAAEKIERGSTGPVSVDAGRRAMVEGSV